MQHLKPGYASMCLEYSLKLVTVPIREITIFKNKFSGHVTHSPLNEWFDNVCLG